MKKLMAILLILALLLPYLGVLAEEVEREVLNCGDYKYSLLEDGMAEMPSTGEPLIPLGEDLRPYQPEIHGYFGHLPVRVTGENEAADCLLPVLVYGGGVFADAEALNDTVPGLDIREVDGDVYVTALSRELVFPADSPLARWTVGPPHSVQTR